MGNINWLTFCLIGLIFLSLVSIILIFSIEAFKKIFTIEKIKERFGSIEIFSAFISIIISLIIYVLYILIMYIGKYKIGINDWIIIIILGILFVYYSICGSALGFDKVINPTKEWLEYFKKCINK